MIHAYLRMPSLAQCTPGHSGDPACEGRSKGSSYEQPLAVLYEEARLAVSNRNQTHSHTSIVCFLPSADVEELCKSAQMEAVRQDVPHESIIWISYTVKRAQDCLLVEYGPVLPKAFLIWYAHLTPTLFG